MNWLALAVAVLLIISCFIPWVYIESRNITISGIDATGTNYGKPGYFHIVLVTFFIVFTLIAKVWAKRFNLIVVALNTAWAARNFFIIATCQGGECPERKIGLYLMLIASLLMLLTALFPDLEIKSEKKNDKQIK